MWGWGGGKASHSDWKYIFDIFLLSLVISRAPVMWQTLAKRYSQLEKFVTKVMRSFFASL